jgi:inner membrane protein
MCTIMTHALLPLTAAGVLGSHRIPRALALAGAALAILPDADVIGFRFGIDYGSVLGHRGISHALWSAMFVGALVAASGARRWPGVGRLRAALFLTAAMGSHGLLDTLTDGGKGVMLFWPVSAERWFAWVQPIRVAPIGMRFFTMRGIDTVRSEALWLWLPCLMLLALAAWLRLLWRDRGRKIAAGR